jgi:hypothetical protein
VRGEPGTQAGLVVAAGEYICGSAVNAGDSAGEVGIGVRSERSG